jgi:hypothetical protein
LDLQRKKPFFKKLRGNYDGKAWFKHPHTAMNSSKPIEDSTGQVRGSIRTAMVLVVRREIRISRLADREFPRHDGNENDYADSIADHSRSVDLVLLDHDMKTSQSQE